MTEFDTIAAVATPPGRGGIGIVRLSGPRVRAIARAVLGEVPEPRVARYRRFLDRDHRVLDTGIALFYPAPRSYTGEDTLELQGHGGKVVLDMLLERVLTLGARIACPGEFTLRAFLHDKMDLTQAEAVADLIDSRTEAAARSAQRSLQGEFSRCINDSLESLVALRAWIEAAIDFPDEEEDFLGEQSIEQRLGEIVGSVRTTLANARRGVLLQAGVTVVIAGRPNVGKSTLLNRLGGRDTAIVTAIPGTTRDLLRATIDLDGLPVELIDTAGLRSTDDEIEKQGIERAWAAVHEADLILLMIDDRVGIGPEESEILAAFPSHTEVIVIRNKIDLSGSSSGHDRSPQGKCIAISALTGAGVDLLAVRLKSSLGFDTPHESTFIARRRHVDALERCLTALERGESTLTDIGAGELVAEELRYAQLAMSEVTGQFSNEDLLDRIFSTFCIGK